MLAGELYLPADEALAAERLSRQAIRAASSARFRSHPRTSGKLRRNVEPFSSSL